MKTILTLFVASSLLSSCATIFASKNAEVILSGATKNLKVYENGTEIPVEKVHSHGQAAGDAIIYFYSSGIKLDRKKNHHIELVSGDKKAEFDLKSKVSGGYVVLNLITTGPIGIAVDASTKKWKTLKPRYIDVDALLNGTQAKSKRQMKKDIKKKALKS
jgi:hypothetical protein